MDADRYYKVTIGNELYKLKLDRWLYIGKTTEEKILELKKANNTKVLDLRGK